MWPPVYSTRSRQHPLCLHHLRIVYQQGAASFLETGKSLKVPGPDCTEDARRCPNVIARSARLVSAGRYSDVHWCATEQFNARTCPFGKITNLVCLQETNNISQSAGFSISTAKATAIYLHLPRDKVRRTTSWGNFNITLNARNQWSVATKQVRGLYAQTFFSFWVDFIVIMDPINSE